MVLMYFVSGLFSGPNFSSSLGWEMRGHQRGKCFLGNENFSFTDNQGEFAALWGRLGQQYRAIVIQSLGKRCA